MGSKAADGFWMARTAEALDITLATVARTGRAYTRGVGHAEWCASHIVDEDTHARAQRLIALALDADLWLFGL